MTGQKFGRLTACYRTDDFVCSSGRKLTMWHCVCDCGNEKDVASTSLTQKLTTSCGCWDKEQKLNKDIKHRKHGERGTVLYSRWRGMRRRCTDKNNKRYFGRNIDVCEEWKNSYIAFAKWARNNGFKEELTLDRIDNNKGYCPENCRWVDDIQQQNNKENNVYIEYNGVTHTQAEWSKITGISRYAIYYRLEHGWSVERTLTQPMRVTKRSK